MKLRMSVMIANRNADGTLMRDEAGTVSRRMFDVVVAQSDAQALALFRILGVEIPTPGSAVPAEIALDAHRVRTIQVALPQGCLTVDGRPEPAYVDEPALAMNVRDAIQRAQTADAEACLTVTGERSFALTHMLQDA